MAYTIRQHSHIFAAWAASTAARVSGCRFTVEQGRAILEYAACAGLPIHTRNPSNLPVVSDIDIAHREWRQSIIAGARKQNLKFTHGVAAKLINVYLKSVFVCGGHADHPRVRALHPPIDQQLLDSLYCDNVGKLRAEWDAARRIRWSKLNSREYEALIRRFREVVGGREPLWCIEEHWRGYR